MDIPYIKRAQALQRKAKKLGQGPRAIGKAIGRHYVHVCETLAVRRVATPTLDAIEAYLETIEQEQETTPG
jgi:ParB-like chromosome segregation protein Spo0J